MLYTTCVPKLPRGLIKQPCRTIHACKILTLSLSYPGFPQLRVCVTVFKGIVVLRIARPNWPQNTNLIL